MEKLYTVNKNKELTVAQIMNSEYYQIQTQIEESRENC